MPKISFATLIDNFALYLGTDGALWTLVTTICWLAAGIFGITAAMQLKSVAEDGGRTTMRAPIMTFLAAVLMATAPNFLQTLVGSVYGTELWGKQPLSYANADSKSSGGGTIKSVLMLVSFVGYCFFVRGIWILKEAGEPQKHHGSTVGKAIVTLIAGMAAIYIDITLKFVAGTFGWDLSNYVN